MKARLGKSQECLLGLALLCGLLLAAAGPIAAQQPAEPPEGGAITFEEPIPQPDMVRSQYCNNPAANKGVEFLGSGARIFVPPVTTASPTHALTNHFPGSEFGELNKLEIRFTTGQSLVRVQAGLDHAISSGVIAHMWAYSSETPGTGFVALDNIQLGPGPIEVANELVVTSASANIRSVEIWFNGADSLGVHEVIDDLSFSTVGPPCVTDTAAPAVQITKPAADGWTTQNPQANLAFTAQDDKTGIARMEVTFLAGSSPLGSWGCGGTAQPKCIHDDATGLKASYNVLTVLPDGTDKIQVRAWDYVGQVGQASRAINFGRPGPNMNLWAMGLEITQAVQPWVARSNTRRRADPAVIPVSAESAPFVRGKRTVVRVYPGIEGTGSVPAIDISAVLTCQRESSLNPCSGPASVAPVRPITADPADNNALDTMRLNADKSWSFVLPQAWTEMSQAVRLKAKITTPWYLPECLGCDDGANTIAVSSVAFAETSPLKLHLQWACVRRKSTDPVTTCDTAPNNAHVSIFQSMNSMFVQAYPVPATDIELTAVSPVQYPFDGQFAAGLNGAMTSDRMDAFFNHMWDLAQQAADGGNLPINEIYFGFVPAPITAWAGLGDTNTAIGKVDAASMYEDIETAAEEIGHSLGRPHASCDHGEDGCEPAPAVFPCAHGGICSPGFDTYGLRVIDPGNPPTGAHAHDFMSYGSGVYWVSPYTYRYLHEALAGAAAAAASAAAGVPAAGEAVEDVLWVRGFVSNPGSPGEAATFQPFYQIQRAEPANEPGAGSYSLELQDGGGQPLFARRFEPEVVTGDPPDPTYQPPARFFETVPFYPQLAQIVLKQGGEVLAERVRTANRPSVTITAPAAGASWPAEGERAIAWSASDADGGDLFFLVQYSADGGATWQTLVSDWTQNSLAVNCSDLPGSSNALIRVLATDGVNTAAGLSSAFQVGGKPPEAWIVSPKIQGHYFPSFEEGQVIILEGNGLDLEDRSLGDEAFSWRADGMVLLGTGRRVDVAGLPAGTHQILLRVRDPDGMEDTAGVLIAVTPRPNSQPLAEAGPDPVTVAGATVQLDGSRSADPDGDPLGYHWSIVQKPVESSASLSDPAAAMSGFWADTEGDYQVQLAVDDGQVSSLPDTVAVHVGGEAEARIYLSPPESTLTVSDTATVDILIEAVENLYGAQVEMTFDAGVVEVVDAYPTVPGVQIEEGDFPVPDVSLLNAADNLDGTIRYTVSLQGPKPGVSGSGTLARITFHAKRPGAGRIGFSRVILSDPQSVQIQAGSYGAVVIAREAATGALVGRVILERRTSNSGAMVCAGSQCTAAQGDGAYSLPGMPLGPATVSVSRMSYLRSQVEVEVPPVPTALPDVTLLGGDVNQDDQIELADGNLIGQAWNATPADARWDPRADVTDDGAVNILDRVAVQANWAQAAPGPWPAASGLLQPTPAAAGATAQVIISPTLTTLASAGETAEVDIWVQDVTDLYAARVQITLDPAVLQVQDTDPRPSAPGAQILPGDLLDPMNQQVLVNLADNTAGTVDFAVTQAYPASARSGSGVLATVVFKAAGLGSSAVHLVQARLLDGSWPEPAEIPAETQDGLVEVGAGRPVYLPLVLKGAGP